MKHLNYDEFTELMENKGNVSVVTNDGVYEFTGISKYKVCIELSFRLKDEYKIGETGYYIRLNNVVTTTEAQSMYMSLK